MEEHGEPCPTCSGRGWLPPEKVCANRTCGRLFRWQEGRAVKGQNRGRGVIYCSQRCAKAEAQRRARERRRDAAKD